MLNCWCSFPWKCEVCSPEWPSTWHVWNNNKTASHMHAKVSPASLGKCFVMLHSARRIRTRALWLLFPIQWSPSVSLPLLSFRSTSAKVLMWNECLSARLFKRWWPAISTGDALLDASLARCPDALYHPVCVIALGGRKQDTESPSCSAHSSRRGLIKKCSLLRVPGNGQ